MQIDIFEDMNTGGPLSEREINTGKRDGRPRLGVICHGTPLFAASLIWEEPRPGPASCGLAAAHVVLLDYARRCVEGRRQSSPCRRPRRFAQRRLRLAGRGDISGKACTGPQREGYPG